MQYKLTTKQAIAEIVAGKYDVDKSNTVPCIFVDGESRIFVHIGPNELSRLASTRCPANPRVFKTLDAAFKTCMELCASAGLEGFQRIEVTGYVGDYASADVNT